MASEAIKVSRRKTLAEKARGRTTRAIKVAIRVVSVSIPTLTPIRLFSHAISQATLEGQRIITVENLAAEGKSNSSIGSANRIATIAPESTGASDGSYEHNRILIAAPTPSAAISTAQAQANAIKERKNVTSRAISTASLQFSGKLIMENPTSKGTSINTCEFEILQDSQNTLLSQATAEGSAQASRIKTSIAATCLSAAASTANLTFERITEAQNDLVSDGKVYTNAFVMIGGLVRNQAGKGITVYKRILDKI